MNTLSSQTKKSKHINFNFTMLLFSAFLFLSSLNFANKYFYFLFLCFATLFVLGVRTININGGVIALLGISLSYLVFYPDSAYSITGVLKQFVYPLAYLCGLNCLKLFADRAQGNQKQKMEKGFLILCYVIAMGIFVHVFLNLYTNQGLNDREIIDYWGGASSATCNAAMFCFGIGMIPALLLNKSGRFGKLFSIVSLIIFTLFALVLAGRTFFFLFLIVFVFTVLFSAYRDKNFGKALRVMLIVAVISIIMVVLYQVNLFGLKELFESSNFYNRFFGEWGIEFFEDGRMERKIMYLKNMFDVENMFGGGNLRSAANDKYAHELYLDLLSDAGIFAYLIVIYFVVSRTYRAVKLAANENSGYSRLFSAIVFGLFFSLNIEFLIEPIIQGVPWLFPTFCILSGMIDYMILKKDTTGKEFTYENPMGL